MSVTVRLFAAARAAAGTSEIEVPAGRLDEILATLVDRTSPALAAILPHCAVVGSGDRLDPADGTVIAPGEVLDVLPPFAGG